MITNNTGSQMQLLLSSTGNAECVISIKNMIGVVKLPILRHRDVLKRCVINFKRYDF